MIFAVTALLGPLPASALMVPPADSRAAADRQADAALTRVEGLGNAALTRAAGKARRCIDAIRTDCTRASLNHCRGELSHLFDRVQRDRPAQDALLEAALAQAATHLADAVTRLAEFDTAGCIAREAPGVPARFVLSPSGRSAEIKPLVPLRGGRIYDVVVESSANIELSAASPADQTAPALPGIDTVKLGALLNRSRQAFAALPARATYVGLGVRLSHPPQGEDLLELRIAFVPRGLTKDMEVLTSLPTQDARAGLRGYRRRIHSFPCQPAGLTPQTYAPADSSPSSTTVYRGHYPSLDILQNAAVDDSLGDPEPERTELSFRLRLPSETAATTPLILALDGHKGSMVRVLKKHGSELVERGAAVISIDLPYHGTRQSGDELFVTPLAPARLSRNMRQAATDVLAITRQAKHCGFRLPDGSVYQPQDLRFLGYSLGAMVGTIARSVEPDLGTSALLAPGGDLLGWLMLRLGPELGGRYVACIGGPEHGEDCIDDGRCTAPGHCMVDPFFEQLYQRLERPYARATAPGDPLSFASERTGSASKAPLLLITGGEDPALHPSLAAHLADAYDMHVTGPYQRKGPHTHFVQWPAMEHDLHDHLGPRRQAHEFLLSEGRHLLPTAVGNVPPKPPWYSIFEPHRNRR